MDLIARRTNVYHTGLYRLTRRKGVYGFSGVLKETRKSHTRQAGLAEVDPNP
jgi:hypothetical protein